MSNKTKERNDKPHKLRKPDEQSERDLRETAQKTRKLKAPDIEAERELKAQAASTEDDKGDG
jgi:hypothetical protein